MIRKLIAGLAVVGILAVGRRDRRLGGDELGHDDPLSPVGTTTAASARSPVRSRNRLLTHLEKWQTQLDGRITKLQAKQAQLAADRPRQGGQGRRPDHAAAAPLQRAEGVHRQARVGHR